MTHLFVYGSLMFDEILSTLVMHDYKKVDAQLRGYARLTIKGEVYPGLLRAAHARVRGVLLQDIIAEDLQALDRFEGEYYKREAVVVYCGNKPVTAETYVIRQRFRHLLSTSPWDPEQFRIRYMRRFRDRYVSKSG